MRAECRRGEALGEPYEGKLHVRFDEGVLETESRRRLHGHEAGNGGYSQGEAYGPPRQRSTLHARALSGDLPQAGSEKSRYPARGMPRQLSLR
jgi:hypothetical protein